MKVVKFREGRSLQELSVLKKIYCNSVSKVICELQKGKAWTFVSRKCTDCRSVKKTSRRSEI
jgi:hypothetical protein